MSLQKLQNNKIWTLSISMFSSFTWEEYSKRNPRIRSEVRFIQNARKQKYLMDSNLMYTDFIKAHDGLNLGRLENVQLREILSY